jgi:hypothetical protein
VPVRSPPEIVEAAVMLTVPTVWEVDPKVSVPPLISRVEPEPKVPLPETATVPAAISVVPV